MRFPAHGIVGYALFAPTDGLTADVLRGADTPCLVMTRRAGDHLVLAVADPDLRLPPCTPRTTYQPGQPGALRLRLNGAWRLSGPVGGVQQIDAQTLAVTSRDGATVELVLRSQ